MSQTQQSDTKTQDAKDETTSEKSNNANSEPADLWMIRDCSIYEDEYDECTSIKGRFHQYFIYGKWQDCNQWKKDYDNCNKWKDYKDIKAANNLIESERSRRMERLRAHYRNDVWKKRTSPPEDFSKPLPEWMTKRDENTYLAAKAKQIKEGIEDEAEKLSCCIM